MIFYLLEVTIIAIYTYYETEMNNRYIKIIAILLLFGIAFLNYNAFANGHYHIGPNGHIIYHAHPFHHNKNNTLPISKEHHTRIQLLIYNLITSFSILLAVALLLSNALLCFKEWLTILHDHNFVTHLAIFFPSRRGPPSFDF